MAEIAFCRQGEELLKVALGERTEIGRAPECDVVIPDPSVSRVHAVIEQRGDVYHLIDRSGRGTRVGGQAVTEMALQDGANMEFGSWLAVYREQSTAGRTERRSWGRGSCSARPGDGLPGRRFSASRGTAGNGWLLSSRR